MTENVPITNPTVRSDAPMSLRICGASPGKTAPNPSNPRKVAAIRHQKRPRSARDPMNLSLHENGSGRTPVAPFVRLLVGEREPQNDLFSEVRPGNLKPDRQAVA